MKKILLLLICVIIPVSVFCGCGEDEKNEAEQLPYGASMRTLKDTSIEICFDKRYFTDSEIQTLGDYFYSIQTSDAELFESTQEPEYISYLEKNSDQTLDDLFKNIVDNEKASLSEKFEYSYIEVTNCGDKTDDMEITEITDLMNTIYKENGYTETFEENIVDAKFATLDITAKADGKTYNYDDKIVYIFTFKDGIFIFD